jgi:hypothetical protein
MRRPRVSVCLESVVDRKEGELEPIRHADLVKDVREAVLHGLDADRKLLGDVAASCSSRPGEPRRERTDVIGARQPSVTGPGIARAFSMCSGLLSHSQN